MTARMKGRRHEASQVVDAVAQWSQRSPHIAALALVGSYARGAERMASDVDLVLLSPEPENLADSGWFAELLPGAKLVRSLRWGPVHERRYRLRSGLVVELGIAPTSWAALPLDAGTRRVLADGHRILFDDGRLQAAAQAATCSIAGLP